MPFIDIEDIRYMVETLGIGQWYTTLGYTRECGKIPPVKSGDSSSVAF